MLVRNTWRKISRENVPVLVQKLNSSDQITIAYGAVAPEQQFANGFMLNSVDTVVFNPRQGESLWARAGNTLGTGQDAHHLMVQNVYAAYPSEPERAYYRMDGINDFIDAGITLSVGDVLTFTYIASTNALIDDFNYLVDGRTAADRPYLLINDLGRFAHQTIQVSKTIDGVVLTDNMVAPFDGEPHTIVMTMDGTLTTGDVGYFGQRYSVDKRLPTTFYDVTHENSIGTVLGHWPMDEGTGDTLFDTVGSLDLTMPNFNESHWELF